MKAKRIVLALGSNTQAEANFDKAEEWLQQLLPDISFSRRLMTKAVGAESELFLNALATATTTLKKEQLLAELKLMEQEAGDEAGFHRRGIVNLDLDLLQYGDERLHKEDWKRDYVRTLLGDLKVRI